MIFDNSSENKTALSWLKDTLPSKKQAKIAIGYFYLSGFQLVKDDIPLEGIEKPFLKIVMGSETDPETKEELLQGYSLKEEFRAKLLSELSSSNLTEGKRQNIRNLKELIANGLVDVHLYENSKLHAKLYLLLNQKASMHESKGIALMGSSNFTRAGLTQNKELNISFTDKENIDYLNNWFDQLWLESSEFKEDLLKAISISGVAKKESPEQKEYPSLGEQVLPETLFRYLVYRWFDGRVMNMLKKDTLAEFQLVGVLNAIRMLSYYNGAIIADSVGLGKSFIAMAIIEEFIQKKHTDWIQKESGVPGVLIVVPPSVLNQWEELIIGSTQSKEEYEYFKNGQLIKIGKSEFFKNKQVKISGKYKENDKTFEIYDELDNQLLGIIRLYSVGLFQYYQQDNKQLEELKEKFDLIVVDEAHKFKNRNSNRWKSLKVLQKKKNLKFNKMLLLTATPMSNSIYELYNLIRLFNDDSFQPFTLKGVKVSKLFEEYSKLFQEFKIDDSDKKRKELKDKASELKLKVIDEVVLLRTRKYIKQNFQDVKINDKPLEFKDPVVHPLDYSNFSKKEFKEFISKVSDIMPKLEFEHTKLYGAVFVTFGENSKESESKNNKKFIRLSDIFRLLLGKRLESSIFAYEVTIRKIFYKERTALFLFQNRVINITTKQELKKILESIVIDGNLKTDFEKTEEEASYLPEEEKIDWFASTWSVFEEYARLEAEKKKMPADNLNESEIIKLGSIGFLKQLETDIQNLQEIFGLLNSMKEKDSKGEFISIGNLPQDELDIIEDIRKIWIYKYDPKIQALKQILGSAFEQSKKLEVPNISDKKSILFSQYKDTAYYLYKTLEHWCQNSSFAKEFYTDVKHSNRSKIGLVSGDTDSSTRINIKKRFAPKANNGEEEVKRAGELKLLVATDAFSEGVNLQDGQVVVNFDLPWNPMLIVQRVGRINRIGSENDVDVINFYPTEELQLIVTVLTKLKEKIKDITTILGNESKIISSEDEISIETFGQKIRKLSEISIDDLEEMGVSEDMKQGFSEKERLHADEFKLLNAIQYDLRYTAKDFKEFELEKYINKILYSFIMGNGKVYSIYEFQRGKEGERKTLEKKILSKVVEQKFSHRQECPCYQDKTVHRQECLCYQDDLIVEESPLALLDLVKEGFRNVKPTRIFEVAETLQLFTEKVSERKKEIEDSTVMSQVGIIQKINQALENFYLYNMNNPVWMEKFPIVVNKLNLLKPTEHVPPIKKIMQEHNLWNEAKNKALVTDQNKATIALELLYEYLKDKSDIDYTQEVKQYGWFYERAN